jgi:hypothetical protein
MPIVPFEIAAEPLGFFLSASQSDAYLPSIHQNVDGEVKIGLSKPY